MLKLVKTPHTRTHLRIPIPAFKPEHSQPATWFRPATWNGNTVLLICGAGDHRTSFKGVLFEALLEQHLAVLTVDPPGHGEFQQVPMTMETAQHAAQAASNWLHAQQGVAQVAAVGTSFGGNQTAWLAAHDPRIKALVTIESPVRLDSVTKKVIRGEAVRLLLLPKNIALLRYLSPFMLFSEFKSIKGAVWGQDLYSMVDAFDMLGLIKKIGTRPTLFVHGTQDYAVPARNSLQMYDAAEPDKKLLLVKQATHMSLIVMRKPMQTVAKWVAQKMQQD